MPIMDEKTHLKLFKQGLKDISAGNTLKWIKAYFASAPTCEKHGEPNPPIFSCYKCFCEEQDKKEEK